MYIMYHEDIYIYIDHQPKPPILGKHACAALLHLPKGIYGHVSLTSRLNCMKFHELQIWRSHKVHKMETLKEEFDIEIP